MNSHHGRSTVGPAPAALVVEDDPDLSTALVEALRGAGYRPRGVFTALEALRVIAHDEPDIVLLDLGLPDVDGADALRMMRGASNVPVVVATARRDELRVVFDPVEDEAIACWTSTTHRCGALPASAAGPGLGGGR